MKEAKETAALTEAHASVTPRGRLMSIDLLRALAALAVVLYHIRRHPDDDQSSIQYFALLPFEFGTVAVVLFIVISGFCIHVGTAKGIVRGQGVQANWRKFWWRRTYRLYPPYLVAIVLSLGIYYAVNPGDRSGFERIVALPLDLVTHLLMIHNLFKDYVFGLGNGSFWTLGLEEQLYGLYALLLVLRRRMSMVKALYVALAVTLCWKWVVYANSWWLVHYAGTDDQTIGFPPLQLGNFLSQWPFAAWFYWVLGALAAEAYVGAVTLPRWCSRYGVAFTFAGVSILCDWRISGLLLQIDPIAASGAARILNVLAGLATVLADPLFAMASFVLINAFVKTELEGKFQSRWVKLLAGIGVMSYSLYLVHTPLMRLGENLLPLEFGWGDIALRFVLYVPLCLGGAALFFVLVERRFLFPTGTNLAAAPIPKGCSRLGIKDFRGKRDVVASDS